MFEAFKNFIADFADGGKHPSQFADDDYRLAAAALLVHAAAIDGEILPSERDKLHGVIKQCFALDDARDRRADRQGDGGRAANPSTFIISPIRSTARSTRTAAPASSR